MGESQSSGHGSEDPSQDECLEVRINVTESRTLLPKPCVPEAVPRDLCDHIHPEHWFSFAEDTNRELNGWQAVAKTTKGRAQALLFISPLLGAACIFLILDVRRSEIAEIGELFALLGCIICLILACTFIWRGAAQERRAREDLQSILEWHSERRSDGVTFQLSKERAAHYFIRIVVGALNDEESREESYQGSEGTDEETSGRIETGSLTEMPVPTSDKDALKEPLLTADEREATE